MTVLLQSRHSISAARSTNLNPLQAVWHRTLQLLVIHRFAVRARIPRAAAARSAGSVSARICGERRTAFGRFADADRRPAGSATPVTADLARSAVAAVASGRTPAIPGSAWPAQSWLTWFSSESPAASGAATAGRNCVIRDGGLRFSGKQDRNRGSTASATGAAQASQGRRSTTAAAGAFRKDATTAAATTTTAANSSCRPTVPSDWNIGSGVY